MALRPLDPIGHLPKHRSGGLSTRHKVVYALSKPAAAFDEVNNQPLTGRALARQSAVKVAGAVGHTGAMLLIGKAADGHDAFGISKGHEAFGV